MNMRRLAGFGAAGLLGAGALAGVAAAAAGHDDRGGSAAVLTAEQEVDALGAAVDDGSADDDTAGSPRLNRRHPGLRRALRGHVEHGEFVVRTAKGTRTVDVQRGAVTQVNATAMTVRSEDGFTETWSITSDTRVRGRAKAPADVHVGDQVRVVGPKKDGGATATRIGVRPKQPGT